MKRILSIIFLTLGLMSAGKRVDAAVVAAVVPVNPDNISKSLYNKLDPASSLAVTLVAEPTLLNHNPAGVADAGNPYNAWQIEPLAGLLLARLAATAGQPVRNELAKIVETPLPGMAEKIATFLATKGYNGAAWTLNKLWNGLTSTATHINNHRVKYIILVALIALALTSPTSNPWDHEWILGMRNNKTVVVYWEQLKNYVASHNKYVATMNTFAKEQNECLNIVPSNSASASKTSCTAAIENAVVAARDAAVAQAEKFNKNKWFFQAEESVDPSSYVYSYTNELNQCLACSGNVFEQCKAMSKKAKIFDRFLAWIFSNGCN